MQTNSSSKWVACTNLINITGNFEFIISWIKFTVSTVWKHTIKANSKLWNYRNKFNHVLDTKFPHLLTTGMCMSQERGICALWNKTLTTEMFSFSGSDFLVFFVFLTFIDSPPSLFFFFVFFSTVLVVKISLFSDWSKKDRNKEQNQPATQHFTNG